MPDRRSSYFVFQGLFMSVLLLIFIYGVPQHGPGWHERFASLAAILGTPLVLIRIIPMDALSSWGFQAALFVGDAAVASVALQWAQAGANLYLIYVLLIFGTALSRSLLQSLFIALVSSILFFAKSYRPGAALSQPTGFWLQFFFIWVAACLMALLSADAERAQSEDRRTYEKRLVDAERLSSLGQMAAEVAHKIKAPLTTIMVNAEYASAKTRAPGLTKVLGEIREEAARCGEILKDVLNLGRIEELDLDPTDFAQCVRSALRAAGPQIRKSRLKIDESGLETPARVAGDKTMIAQAISALLQNAIEASHNGGIIRLQLVKSRRPLIRRDIWKISFQDRFYRLTIIDSGSGIDPKDLPNLFKPFFTTKKDGTGLGLAGALRIIQKHRGTIEASSLGRGLGARFVVTIPALNGKAL
jgi:signal transduction histidine kinase